MIDVKFFQTLLLVVCILAAFAGMFIFSAADSWSGWIRRFAFRSFALILSASAVFAALLLIILK